MKRITLALVFILFMAILFTSCGEMAFENAQTPATESYSSEESNYDENNRKVVKTASISLEVDQLEQSILTLKSFLKPINGYVYNYEISNHSYETDSYQKNMDSTVSVEKVTPEGNLSVRVPIEHGDSFLNFILNPELSGQIVSLKINDQDITENLWEKNQVASVYERSGKAQKSKGNGKNISYDNSTAIDAIKVKATAAKMNYKTKYLWFDIDMKAKPFYKTKTTIAAKVCRTPIHIGFANALVKGWHVCADLILALVSIWPLLMIIALILFFIRKYRLRTS